MEIFNSTIYARPKRVHGVLQFLGAPKQALSSPRLNPGSNTVASRVGDSGKPCKATHIYVPLPASKQQRTTQNSDNGVCSPPAPAPQPFQTTRSLELLVPYHLIILDQFCTPRHCPPAKPQLVDRLDPPVSDRFKKRACTCTAGGGAKYNRRQQFCRRGRNDDAAGAPSSWHWQHAAVPPFLGLPRRQQGGVGRAPPGG